MVLVAIARAVKASPPGGLRPALTALLLNRRQGKPAGYRRVRRVRPRAGQTPESCRLFEPALLDKKRLLQG